MRIPKLMPMIGFLLTLGASACLDGEPVQQKGEDTTQVVPASRSAGLRADGAIVIVRGAK